MNNFLALFGCVNVCLSCATGANAKQCCCSDLTVLIDWLAIIFGGHVINDNFMLCYSLVAFPSFTTEHLCDIDLLNKL